MPIPGISCMGVAGGAGEGFDLSFLTSSANNTVASSHTFSSVSFGDASPRRVIAVGVFHDDGDAFSSATIGGVSATLAVTRLQSGGSFPRISIIYASVPTGTSGSIVINHAGGTRCAIAVWRILTNTAAPTNTGSAQATPPSVFATAPVNGGGVVVAGAQNLYTWTPTNFTEDAEVSTSTRTMQAGSFTTSATLTATPSSSVPGIIAYASWGP